MAAQIESRTTTPLDDGADASREAAGRPVLVAALSTRALAQSARRAGFAPLVVDAFADTDTIAAAARCVRLPASARRGFSAPAVLAALDALGDGTDEPVGLVLGAGFEHDLAAVTALSERHRLLGCGADTIERVKNPAAFFPTIGSLGLSYPEVRLDPPIEGGWLGKQIGGSGGAHVAAHRPGVTARRGVYFQRGIDGEAVSLLGVAGAGGFAFVGASRQWTNPAPRRPFRYGGAAGPIALRAALLARLRDTAAALTATFGLIGLVSFDFLLDGETPYLLEVNPRPGATIDIFDDGRGSLFAAHVAAALASGPAEGLPALLGLGGQDGRPYARAAAYLYADRGALVFPELDWPDWAADRSPPGRRIARHQPLATVFAQGETADHAEKLCRDRLGALEEMIYGRA